MFADMDFPITKLTDLADADTLPVMKITSYPLEQRDYRPFAQAAAAVYEGGLLLRLWAFEAAPSPLSSLGFLLRGRSILSSLILIIGGVGIFIMSIELYVDRWLTGRWQPGWSLVVAAVCLSMMIPLIVVRWRPALRDEVRRRFHM